METKWTAIMMIGLAFAVALGAGLSAAPDAKVAIEAAKAGLQQCPTERGLAWQKECKG